MTNTIYKAFIAACKEIQNPKKNSTNPHFRNKYADLEAVLGTVKGPLAAHGLVVLQTIEVGPDSEPVLKTGICHESGDFMDCGSIPLVPTKRDPQGYGSAITYARRYALMAVFGLAAEDDDGNAASEPAQDSAVNRVKARFQKNGDKPWDLDMVIEGINACKTIEALEKMADRAMMLPADVRSKARAVYGEKLAALKEAS